MQEPEPLNRYLFRYWEIFWHLNPDRPVYQGGIGAIPLQTILAWMKEIEGEFDPDKLREAVRYIRCIDKENINAANTRMQNRINSGGGSL